jgi:hypothetical protein
MPAAQTLLRSSLILSSSRSRRAEAEWTQVRAARHPGAGLVEVGHRRSGQLHADTLHQPIQPLAALATTLASVPGPPARRTHRQRFRGPVLGRCWCANRQHTSVQPGPVTGGRADTVGKGSEVTCSQPQRCRKRDRLLSVPAGTPRPARRWRSVRPARWQRPQGAVQRSSITILQAPPSTSRQSVNCQLETLGGRRPSSQAAWAIAQGGRGDHGALAGAGQMSRSDPRHRRGAGKTGWKGRGRVGGGERAMARTSFAAEFSS